GAAPRARRAAGGRADPWRAGGPLKTALSPLRAEPYHGPVVPGSRPPRTLATSSGSQVGATTIAYDKERRSASNAIGAEVAAAREADLKERLKPLYLAFLRDWAALCDEARSMAKALGESERRALLERLRVDFPAHHWEDEFPELGVSARARPSGPTASSDAAAEALASLNELAAHLLRRRQPLATASDVRAFVGRLAEVMDVFLEHTHNLLKGFQRLESDMALRVLGREPNPVDRARDARDLAIRLLDFSVEGASRAPGW